MKKLLKETLVPILSSNVISNFADRLFGSGIPIFMLHRMCPDSSSESGLKPSYLRRCLKYLNEKGYRFVSTEEIALYIRGEIDLPKKSVAFTIDDGFIDQATIAAPVFIEFNCPLTIFVITGFLDGELWPWYSIVEYIIDHTKVDSFNLSGKNFNKQFSIHDSTEKAIAKNSILEMTKLLDWNLVPGIIDNLAKSCNVRVPSSPPENSKPLTWEMAKSLEKRDIKFGPHTVSHPILSKVDSDKSKVEITRSWQRLEEELVSPSPIFCYPNGRICDFGAREIDTIKNLGLIGAVSTTPSQVIFNNASRNDIFQLPRYSLPSSFLDFKMYCSWIEYSKERLRN